jgi:dihydrodipicolinate synthase/N-acetylneuraminate lyase
MEELVKISSIIGLKQSNYDISQTLEIIRRVGDQVSVLTGIDSQLFVTLSLGGRGVFSTAASVVPKKMVEIYAAFESGDLEKARDLQIELQVLNKFFEYDPGYVAPCKEALAIRGLSVGKPRSPLPLLTSDEKNQIRQALKELNLAKRGVS